MANAGKHPRLIEPTRERLKSTGKPYIIENVPGAPLLNAFTLCGSSFGLETPSHYQIRRHRLFETNFDILMVPPCQHGSRTIGLFGDKARDTGQEKRHYAKPKDTRGEPLGVKISQQDAFIAMQIVWMNIKELCQAIPPAYTEYIGKELMKVLS
jgi:DNA (cytosine-5)-methyltransferase 1